jgi:hypothetical protein
MKGVAKFYPAGRPAGLFSRAVLSVFSAVFSVVFILFFALVFTAAGCGSATKTDPGTTDPGTAKGTYTIVVTGAAGGGPSQYKVSASVPITIQ